VCGGGGGGGGGARDTESKTRTPHKDVGKKHKSVHWNDLSHSHIQSAD